MFKGFRYANCMPWIAFCFVRLYLPIVGAANIEWPRFEWNPNDFGMTLETFYRKAIENRLEVGIRIGRFNMHETRRPEDWSREETFLGYINRLKPKQSSVPQLSIGYHFNRYVMLEYSRDRVAARTWNFNNQLSDGVAIMSGPVIHLFAKYPIREIYIPYLGLGYAPWKGSFDHDEWWTLGWSSPEQYEAAGKPSTSPGDRRRVIKVDNSTSMVISGGLEVRATRHLLIDVRVSALSMSPEARFFQVQNDTPMLERKGKFNLSHTRYSLGLRMIF